MINEASLNDDKESNNCTDLPIIVLQMKSPLIHNVKIVK
jgi:hypothetical protein